mmetsp:Transcript_20669/g.43072  ORF Transcript_20669/g.43072 Transcript_20669/m.43072 type:complete len:89 (-) Transcript_20669:37-303(-)
MGLLTPSPSINYTVISYMYAACCLLCVLFYALERAFTNSDEEGGNLEQVKGVYVIFLPFWPCLMWSCVMVKMSGGGGGGEPDTKKKED